MLFSAYKNIKSQYVRCKPTNLVLLLTERCNAQCIMCSIWKNGFSHGDEMSADQYDVLLKNPFFNDIVNVMISGGEALLRNDIDQIVTVLMSSLPRLKRITIATNGLATDLINKQMSKLAVRVNNFHGNLHLVSQVSFDGLTEVHDRIRAPGAGIKVKKTLKKLMDLRKKYSFYKINAGCVIQPLNIDEIDNVFDFLTRHKIESIFTVICFDEHYFQNSDSDKLRFNGVQKTKLKKVLKRIARKEKNVGKKFLYSQFRCMLNGGKNLRGCPALRDTITISHAGDILPCLNSGGMKTGNILSDHVDEIWYSAATQKICRQISNEKCTECMLACGVGYLEALKFAVQTVGGRFVD